MGKKKGLFGKIVGGIFAAGISKDIHEGQVRAAIKTAKKKKLPHDISDQINVIDKSISDLEDFLKTV